MTMSLNLSRKDKIRNWIERKFDRVHQITDKLPLGILDGILHGTSRGVHNYLMDKHPQKDESSSTQTQVCTNKVCPEIKLFFESIKSINDWKKNYPIRFNEFRNICMSKENLGCMLDSLENGITISCPGYKTITFKITNEIRLNWENFIHNKLGLHPVNQLNESHDKILRDLELISNKLTLLQFNQSEILTKEIRDFVSNFEKEVAEIKTSLAHLSTTVERIDDTSTSTLTKVTNIEDIVTQLSAQQNEIKLLINQILGQ